MVQVREPAALTRFYAVTLSVVLLFGLSTRTRAETEADQATELLGLALACQGQPSVYGRSRINFAFKSLGDAKVLRVERLRVHTDDSMAPLGFETLAIEREDVQVIAANYSDLNLTVIRDDGKWTLKMECKNKKYCMGVHLKNQISCEVKREGPKVCDDKLVSSVSSSSFSEAVFNLCPSQLENIRLALSILAPNNANLAPSDNNYGVVKVKKFDGLAVRASQDPNAPMVGVLPSEGSGVSISTCENAANVKGGWCKVEWGNIVGWASAAYLGAKTNNGPPSNPGR